jgi:hypothetical protein
MWDMIWNSAGLFLRGKLFKDTRLVLMLLAANIILAAVVVVAGHLAGIPYLVDCLVAGLLCGTLQPILFLNLKYA